MFPEYEWYQFSPEVVDELKEKITGVSSTPIYSQMRKKEEYRDQVEEARDKFLADAQVFTQRSFDIDGSQIPYLIDALSGALFESLAGSQESIADKYGNNQAVFNRGFVAAIATVQNLLKSAVQ